MNTFVKLIVDGALIAALAGAAVPASAHPSAPAACATRDAEGTMTSNIPLDLPPIAARINPAGATAIVEVDLDARGIPARTAIVTSSGWPSVDAAAQKSVLAQTYTPAIRNCAAVPASYAVTVQF